MCRQPLMNSFRQAQTPIHEDDSSLNVIDIRHPRKCIRPPRERGGPRSCQLPIDSSAAFILTTALKQLT